MNDERLKPGSIQYLREGEEVVNATNYSSARHQLLERSSTYYHGKDGRLCRHDGDDPFAPTTLDEETGGLTAFGWLV